MAIDTSSIPTTLTVDMLRYIHSLVKRDFHQFGHDYKPPKKKMIEEWLTYIEIKIEEYDASKPKQEKLL